MRPRLNQRNTFTGTLHVEQTRNGLDIGFDDLNQSSRANTDPQAEHNQWSKCKELARIHVRDFVVAMTVLMWFFERPKEDTLHGCQQIPASAAYSGLALNMPASDRNSPMKPFRPGRPILAMEMNTMLQAIMGSRLARPLRSSIMRVW